MLRSGGHMAGFNMVSYAARNVDNLLVGWYWGAALLGLYNQAYRLALTPIRQINDPLTRVVVPTLSRLADEPRSYRRYFLHAVSAIGYITMPLAALLMVFAEPIIRLLLGRQWLDATPIFQSLAIGALLQPMLNAMDGFTSPRVDPTACFASVSRHP
jgi:PST family polysaccharide transporter